MQPIYTGQAASVDNFAPGFWAGATNTSSGTESTATPDPAIATSYYLDDQVGTAQLELAAGGWPLWKGEFAPFGDELDTQATANP